MLLLQNNKLVTINKKEDDVLIKVIKLVSELNCDYAKPITSALKEVFDLKTIEIKRISHISKISYFKV